MSVLAFRVRNFMGFVDSGWIDLPSICLLFGRNSSGKSALLKALRMLQQSLVSDPEQEPLILSSEDGVELGTYWDLVHGHNTALDIEFGFICQVPSELLMMFKSSTEILARRLAGLPVISEEEARVRLQLRFGLVGRDARQVRLTAIKISLPWTAKKEGKSEVDEPVFYAEWLEQEAGWWFDPLLIHDSYPLWAHVISFSAEPGFLPRLPDPGRQAEGENPSYYVVLRLLEQFRWLIATFLTSIVYLGPTRSEPQRFYYVPSSSGQSAGGKGISSIQAYLALWGKPEWHANHTEVNESLARLKLGLSIQAQPLQSGRGAHEPLFELQVEETGQGDARISVCDVGFGLSQVLPIVLEAVLAKEGSLIIVEQPELHLHPGAQTELGDLFITASKRKVRFLIETHSEHLWLRIQRRVIESEKRLLTEEHLPYVTPNQATTYFLDRHQGISSVHRVAPELSGQTVYPAGFEGFFADDMRETALLTGARLGIDLEIDEEV